MQEILPNVKFTDRQPPRIAEGIFVTPFKGPIDHFIHQCSHHLVSRIICDFCAFNESDKQTMKNQLIQRGYTDLVLTSGLRNISIVIANIDTANTVVTRKENTLFGLVAIKQPSGKDSASFQFIGKIFSVDRSEKGNACYNSKINDPMATYRLLWDVNAIGVIEELDRKFTSLAK